MAVAEAMWWVVGGIETKASPSAWLWLRARQKNAVNSGHFFTNITTKTEYHSSCKAVTKHSPFIFLIFLDMLLRIQYHFF